MKRLLLEPIHCLRQHWLAILSVAMSSLVATVLSIQHLAPATRTAWIDRNSGLLRYDFCFLGIPYHRLEWKKSLVKAYERHIGPARADHDWVYCNTNGFGCLAGRSYRDSRYGMADFSLQNAFGNTVLSHGVSPYGNQYGYTDRAMGAIVANCLSAMKQYDSSEAAVDYLMKLDDHFAPTTTVVDLDQLPSVDRMLGDNYTPLSLEPGSSPLPDWAVPR